MPVPRLLGSCALVFLSLSCTSGGIMGSGEGLTHAVAAQSCGPADGPAVSIYLSPTPVHSLEPSAPYVRIDVWQPLDHLTERSWTLSGTAADADGAAVYYTGTPDLEVATSGQVTVSSVASDRTIEGFADIHFPTSGHVRSEFHAVWNSRVMLCG